NALAGIANVAAALHRPTLAAHLLASVANLRTEIDAGMEIQQLHRFEQALKTVKASLRATTFEAEWEIGRSLSLEAAVREAISGFDEQSTSITGNHGAELTPREYDVLRLIANGLTDREIAEQLHISPRTVGFHVTNLLAKLEVDSRTAAAALALRNHLA
ncbi:MAG: response regulator transcription factor, partial [Thermomicrobiales bacterium]